MDWRDFWRTMVWSRALFVLFLFSAWWSASIFFAPMTIAPGTFAYTTGRANAVDHWDLYAGPAFNWYAKVVYVLGDAECHQLWYRSFWINGNQMPVDARDTSIYLFGTFGLFWAMAAAPSIFVSQGIVNAFPPRVQGWARRIGGVRFAALVVGLGLLPVAVDGTVQLFQAWTHYESTNPVRVVTGISCGLVAGLLLGTVVKSISLVGREAREMRRLGRSAP